LVQKGRVVAYGHHGLTDIERRCSQAETERGGRKVEGQGERLW